VAKGIGWIFFQWLIWCPARFFLLRAPYGAALFAGRIVGSISYFLLSKRRNALSDEYKCIFPNKAAVDIKNIVKENFMLLPMDQVDYVYHGRLDSENVEQMIEIQGLPALDESLKRGKGVIMLTFHFGCHLQIMPALGFRGYKVCQVAREWSPSISGAGNPAARFLAKRLFAIRTRHSGSRLPAQIIPIKHGGFPRALFECLRKNGILVVAMDGGGIGSHTDISFFHMKGYPFAAGPLKLALRAHAAVHPVFIVRQENWRNRAVIGEEIVMERRESEEETIRWNARKVVALLEKYVADYPAHYGTELLSTRPSRFANHSERLEGGSEYGDVQENM
jgi:KDO2-lipid IV(A) lauroyltransferase